MSLPLNIDFQQIVIHIFNLVLLFGGLYLLLYKPIKKFMDSRTEEYKKADEQVSEKLKSAQNAAKLAEQKLAGTQAEISSMKAQAKSEAEIEAEDIISQAKKEKERIIRNAEEAAVREKNRMINEAREELAELAIKAAEKVLMEKSVNTKGGKDD